MIFVPLIPVPRETAPYFVVIRTYEDYREGKQSTVYVKEGNFFRAQGGLKEEWGANWLGIQASSIDDARLRAHASAGTTCPQWHLGDRS